VASRPVRSQAAVFLGISLGVSSQVFGSSAQAITFDFVNNPAITTSSASYVVSGLTLTVDGAQGVGQPTVASTVGSGGINRDINNGLCARFRTGSALTGSNRCQYLASTDASLTGFKFRFDQPVVLKTLQAFRAGGTTKGSLNFTTGASSQLLEFLNPGGAETTSGSPLATLSFPTPFYVPANTDLFIDTSASEFLSGSTSGFRINNLNVEVVPGPLPILGAGAAFSLSRRLRRRVSLSK